MPRTPSTRAPRYGLDSAGDTPEQRYNSYFTAEGVCEKFVDCLAR
jgi:hypothetical protein